MHTRLALNPKRMIDRSAERIGTNRVQSKPPRAAFHRASRRKVADAPEKEQRRVGPFQPPPCLVATDGGRNFGSALELRAPTISKETGRGARCRPDIPCFMHVLFRPSHSRLSRVDRTSYSILHRLLLSILVAYGRFLACQC
jgi:hypothetical protein